MGTVKPIPEGFHTITPHLVVRNASEAIEFYKKAFGAEEIMRMPGPDGNDIMHSEIKIGNSMLMIVDEMRGMENWLSPQKLNGTTVALALFVEDADKLFQRAVDAGANVTMPMMDAFWGDRYGKVTDPYGHQWEICTHKEDLTPQEIGKRAAQFFSNPADGGGKS